MAAAPPPPAAAASQMAVNAKRFVLVALTATLAVAAVITLSFVILSPARVHLSVTNARFRRRSPADGGVVELLLILTANNTSERAAVRYESMFIDVSNGTGGPGCMMSSSITTNLTTELPVMILARRRPRHGRDRVANFSAAVLLVPGIWTDSAGNFTVRNIFAVVVTAMARFKVGVARTRLFDIKLACRNVRFVPVDDAGDGTSPVDCVSC